MINIDEDNDLADDPRSSPLEQEDWGFDGNDQETVVARAIYGAAVSSARKLAEGLDLQLPRLTRLYTSARSESDRSAAILLFALVEDLMQEAFQRHLSPNVKGGWSEVFSGNGLLATANDRITLLALLGWIRPATYADLRLMKSIRNRFAHHADVSSFDDANIASWIGALSVDDRTVVAETTRSGGEPPNLTVRQRYLVRSTMVLARLIGDLTVAPVARLQQVHPSHVQGRDWDTYPENLKDVHRVSAECVILVLRGSD